MRKIIAIVIIVVFLLGILYPVKAKEMRKHKSPTLAFLLSAVGTAALFPAVKVSPGLAFGALIIGPSLGHIYTENYGWALVGIGVRGGVLLLGINQAKGKSWDEGMAVAAITVGVMGINAIVDVMLASYSAKHYNESHKSNVDLMPRIDIKEESYGLSVVYCF